MALDNIKQTYPVRLFERSSKGKHTKRTKLNRRLKGKEFYLFQLIHENRRLPSTWAAVEGLLNLSYLQTVGAPIKPRIFFCSSSNRGVSIQPKKTKGSLWFSRSIELFRIKSNFYSFFGLKEILWERKKTDWINWLEYMDQRSNI